MSDEEEAYYFHILSEFAAIIRVRGVGPFVQDLSEYRPDVYSAMRSYNYDN